MTSANVIGIESGDVGRAEKSAELLKSESSSWIAEWVLMTKARKLQTTKLPAAIQVAKLNTRLYPQSFSAFYLLADLLFQDRSLDQALTQATKSLQLEPHNAAILNLVEKIETIQQPLRFTPAGTYRLEYVNDLSGEIQKTDLVIEGRPNGQLSGKKTDPGGNGSVLSSVCAGGNRMWAQDIGLGLESNVNDANADEFRHSQPARETEVQHCAITNTDPPNWIRSVQNGLHFLRREVPDETHVRFLGRNRQDAANLFQRRRHSIV